MTWARVAVSALIFWAGFGSAAVLAAAKEGDARAAKAADVERKRRERWGA